MTEEIKTDRSEGKVGFSEPQGLTVGFKDVATSVFLTSGRL